MRYIGLCIELENCGFRTILDEEERPICPQCYGHLLRYDLDEELQINIEALVDEFHDEELAQARPPPTDGPRASNGLPSLDAGPEEGS